MINDSTVPQRIEKVFLQAQRLQAIGLLASGVAHDFNNYLTAVIGYSEMLLRNLDPRDPLYKYVAEIKKATDDASYLTQHLISFSCTHPLQAELLDLNALVVEIDKVLRRLIGVKIEIMTVLGTGVGLVKADSRQIEQIIVNLVLNACDAMPCGGTLTIETAVSTPDELLPEQDNGSTPGRYVVLSISANDGGTRQRGNGNYFQPFFTARPEHDRQGFGLDACDTIARQLGGCIRISSRPDLGAVVKLYLPQVECGTSDLQKIHGKNGDLPRGTETVLVVEDEVAVLEITGLVLRELGYTVLEARNGEQAMRTVLRRGVGMIHALITDVVMPRMGGKELAEWLRSIYSEAKVIFTSGYPDEVVLSQGLPPSNIFYLRKPYTSSELAHKLRHVLDTPKGGARTQTTSATELVQTGDRTEQTTAIIGH